MGSTLSGSYDANDKRQVNRATIGEGTITVRSDPAQGLAGLNHDLKKAQELTKAAFVAHDAPRLPERLVAAPEGIRGEAGLAIALEGRYLFTRRATAPTSGRVSVVPECESSEESRTSLTEPEVKSIVRPHRGSAKCSPAVHRASPYRAKACGTGRFTLAETFAPTSARVRIGPECEPADESLPSLLEPKAVSAPTVGQESVAPPCVAQALSD